MSKAGAILGKVLGGDKLVSTIMNGLGDLFPNQVEKSEARLRIQETLKSYQISIEEEVTKRLGIDMSSDSWLSKNIRPATLIFIITAYTFFSIADNNLVINGETFHVKTEYVELLGEWGRAIMFFYFGGRTLEKVSTVFQSRRERKKQRNADRTKDQI